MGCECWSRRPQMMAVAAAISATLRTALQEPDVVSTALGDAEDPVAFASQLLREVSSTRDETDATVSATKIVTSFPRAVSFVDQFAFFLAEWSLSGLCPLVDQTPAAEGVSLLTASRDQVFKLSPSLLSDFVGVCVATATDDEKGHYVDRTATMTAFLQALGGARGVLTCLGFRETVGSRRTAPLTREQCVASFQRLQSTKGKLTVGARAFTKHCARSSDGFWGAFKGSDLTKNATALAKLEYIMDHAVWKNIHSLPHGEATFELRDAHGYGARWYIRDESFRGFLEPHMENGHENRWRH